MAREVKFGIVVEAIDKAATTLIAGLGKAAGTSGQAVSLMAKSGEGGLKLMKGAAIGLNQSLELGMKAWRALDNTIGAAIRKSLEYRTVNDATTKEIDKFGNSVNVLQARFGDALLPILQGVARAMRPVVDSATRWVTANRQLIGTKVLEWAMKTASVLVSGIAKGASLIVEIWSGWKMVIGVVDAAVSGFFGMVLNGSAGVLETLGHVAEALHMDGVSESIAGVSGSMRSLATEFHANASTAMQGVTQNAAAMEKWKTEIASVEHAIQTGIGQTGVAAQNALAHSTAGANKSLEAQRAASDRLRGAMAQYYQFAETSEQGLRDIIEANQTRRADLANKQLELMKSRAEGFAALATSVGDVWGSALESITSGAETANKAMGKAAIQTAKTVIMAAMAAAMAKQMEASSWMGVAGIAIGMAAAGIVFGIMQGYMSKVPKAAKGGRITGGIAGVDSVPILAMPGERVLTVDQNRDWEANGGQRGRGGAGATFNVNLNSQLPPDSVQRQRLLRDLRRELEDMFRTGQIKLPAPAGA